MLPPIRVKNSFEPCLGMLNHVVGTTFPITPNRRIGLTEFLGYLKTFAHANAGRVL
jgi:hypothetical protein